MSRLPPAAASHMDSYRLSATLMAAPVLDTTHFDCVCIASIRSFTTACSSETSAAI
jgi:hypothetical protein